MPSDDVFYWIPRWNAYTKYSNATTPEDREKVSMNDLTDEDDDWHIEERDGFPMMVDGEESDV